MPDVSIKVLIAADNPREIFLRVAGGVGGSCTEHHQTLLERKGNSITIKMTIITTMREGEGCTEEDAVGFETVYLGILPPGDYKITVNGMELQLRVTTPIASAYENWLKTIYWIGKNEFSEGVASGVYFYHLSAGDYSATRKMLIQK